jgi:tetratricopeptide (TPR) repeat protein
VRLSQTIELLRTARDAGNVGELERATEILLCAFPTEHVALHAAGHALLALGSLERATAALEAAIAVDPRPEVWNDLGVTLQRRGEVLRAIDAYRTALAGRAAFVEAQANLAAALFLIGSYDDALAHARAAAAIAPATPGIATTLALIEGAIFGPERALARLDEAVARAPDDLAACQARIYVLRQLERPADAAAAAADLLERTGAPRAAELLAMCRRDLGDHPGALALFDDAAARAANPASALAGAGETLLDLGDVAGARERFDRALAADPHAVGVWVGLSQVRHFAAADPALDQMEALLATPALHAREERTLLLFALGKAHLRAGNDARAFACYAEGNRLRRAGITYDVADDERIADAIVATVGRATLDRLAGGGFAEAAPIFVMGMPRSGTSLVEQILASLPGVHGAGELPLARATIQHSSIYPANVAHMQRGDMTKLGATYAAALATVAPPGSRAVDKMPSNVLYAGLLHRMLPRAKLVLCTRDSLDNALSLYTELFSGRQDYAYDLREIARYYRAHERIVAHWKAVLPTDAWFEVQYEKVVTDFDATIGGLLDFCELPWNDICRSFYATSRAVATASRIEVRRPLFRSSIGRAQRYVAYLQPFIDEFARR